MPTPDGTTKVAIVAIHGIGGPLPEVTARRVSEALVETEAAADPASAPTARRETLAIRGAEDPQDTYPANVYHNHKLVGRVVRECLRVLSRPCHPGPE